MRRSSGPRRTANLSESVNRHLNMYALAAGAAGVSMLALAQPAEGKIVYRSTYVKISHYGIFPFALDVNNDGVADFSFPYGSIWDSGSYASAFNVSPVDKRNRVWGAYPYASALNAGIIVGAKGRFAPRGLLMGSISGTRSGHKGFRGPWENRGKGVKRRYLGLSFIINGKIHFGWARINFASPANVILTGYAYETVPGKVIIAGQTEGPDDTNIEEPNASLTVPTHTPASLGILALGASAIAIWRREESVSVGR
jgi:hypothetical protein